MTALDALLPGPRQRPDPTGKPASQEIQAREAPPGDITTAFGRELGRLERPPGRERAASEDEASDAARVQGAADPAVPLPVVDPQAALRALMVTGPEPGAPAAQAPPTTPILQPATPDLIALAERAAASPALPAERPKLVVLGQETHFAPVQPGPPGAAAPMDASPASVTPRPTQAMASPAAAPPNATRPIRPATGAPRSAAPPEPAKPGADASAIPNAAPATEKPAREDPSRHETAAPPLDIAPLAAPIPSGPSSALPAPTLRHLADTIVAEAPPAASVTQPSAAGPAQEGPLRILTIQLQPADLGTVTVRMRLQEGRLEIGMETGRHDTADMLRRDGGALTDLLRAAGYQADLVAIRAGGADVSGGQFGAGQGNGQPTPQPGSGHGAPVQNQSQGQPQGHPHGQQGRQQATTTDGGLGGGSHPGTPERRPTSRTEPNRTREREHETYPVARDRGGLYL